MATPQKDDEQQTPNPPAVGWTGRIEQHYRRIKENAETYPYVWSSYILVYGGFGLWFAYRWRKLRRTEDRVRVLQERLRKLAESESASSGVAKSDNASPPADKAPN